MLLGGNFHQIAPLWPISAAAAETRPRCRYATRRLSGTTDTKARSRHVSSTSTPADPAEPAPQGRVRWRRFALLFVPAMAAAAVLIALTTEGVLAASISVSGSTFEVASSQLKGTGFEQFGGAVTDSKGNQHPVAISAIKSASLANLCQSVSVAR